MIGGLATRQPRQQITLVLFLAGLLVLFPLGSASDGPRPYGTLDGWPPLHLVLGNLAVPPSAWLPGQPTPTPVALRSPRSGESSAWTRGALSSTTLRVAACATTLAVQIPLCTSIGLRWSRPLRGPPTDADLS